MMRTTDMHTHRISAGAKGGQIAIKIGGAIFANVNQLSTQMARIFSCFNVVSQFRSFQMTTASAKKGSCICSSIYCKPQLNNQGGWLGAMLC